MKQITQSIATGILLASLFATTSASAMSQPPMKENQLAIPAGMFQIKQQQADVTGDKQSETITLYGKKEKETDIYNEQLLVTITNPVTKQTISTTIADGGYEPEVTLLDFTGDHVADLFVSAATGGSGGYSDYHLYQVKNNQTEEIALPTIGAKEEGLLGFMFNVLRPIDANQDGVYELQGIERVIGEYNADTRMYLTSFWGYSDQKWNLTKAGAFIPETLGLYGKWTEQKTGAEMEFTPEGKLLKAGTDAGNYYLVDNNHALVISEGKATTISFELSEKSLVWDTDKTQAQLFEKKPE